MISLIKNELIKIFKKKNIYIMFALILVFMLFISCMNKFFNNEMYDATASLPSLQGYLDQLDANNLKQREEYISIKTQVDVLTLQKKYEKESWQRIAIDEYLQADMYNINTIKYNANTDEELLNEEQNKLQSKINKLDSGDWRYFVKEEQTRTEEEILEQEKLLKDASTVEISQINQMINSLKSKKQILDWRLEKDINFGYDYMNEAISVYTNLGSYIRRI